MTPRCEEIQAQAAGLASLAPDDRERRAAETHALICTACAVALAEGVAVVSLIDSALPLAAPQPEALARARQEILAELTADSRSPAFSRGTRSQGRSTTAVAAITALPLLSVVLAVFAGGPAGLQPTTGLKCAVFELVFALVPLVATFVLARRGHLNRPIVAVTAGAVAGAVLGQAALHVACHALPSTSHALVFHTLPVTLALAVGALAGRGIQRAMTTREVGRSI